MDISAELTADLAGLSHALGNDLDLESQLRTLVDDVKAAIASYLGLTLSVVTDDHEISFTVREDGANHLDHGHEITASLRIPLGADPGSVVTSHLVLYAGASGAFVDLAADLTYALALGPTVLTLDGHLSGTDHDGAMNGLAEYSSINQAIGVLIDRGHTPDSARDELGRLAADGDHTVPRAAARLLAELPRRPLAGDTTTS